MKNFKPMKPQLKKINPIPSPKMSQMAVLKRRVDNKQNPGSYPKGDYRQGMPRKMMDLRKLRSQRIITSLD